MRNPDSSKNPDCDFHKLIISETEGVQWLMMAV